MKLALCLLIAVGIPVFATAEDPKGNLISYDDLPRLIKEKNENLKAARATVDAEEKRTGYLARSFLPQISANVGQENFKTDSFSARTQESWRLNASVNLYRGGRDQIDNEIRERSVGVAKFESAREFGTELQKAKNAFWGLVATDKLIADRKEEIRRNDEYIQSARKRAGAGVTTTADAIQFELHKTLLLQNLKKLELEKDRYRNRLSVVLGLDEHENILTNQDFPHPTAQKMDFKDFNSGEQIEIKSLKAQQDIADLRSRHSGRWWHPKLDLYAGYGLPSLSDELTRATAKEKETVAGVILTIDLSSGANDYTESQAQDSQAKAAGFRAAQKIRDLTAVEHELRYDIKLVGELIVDADKDIEKAAQFLKATQGEYGRGVKNGPDLLSAFQKYYEFKERRISLYRSYFDAQAELETLLTQSEAP